MGISAVPNGNILDVSGRCLSAISPVSKRTITQLLKLENPLSPSKTLQSLIAFGAPMYLNFP